jgi:hypothetical protein
MRRTLARCFGRGPVLAAAAIVALTSTALAVSPGAAFAMGALAIGLPSDVSSQGFAFGISANDANPDRAAQDAMDLCLDAKGASSSARAMCRVIRTLHRQCAVVAMDPQKGTPGVGWAVASNAKTAQDRAMEKCYLSAGTDRRSYCAVSGSVCDTGEEVQHQESQ